MRIIAKARIKEWMRRRADASARLWGWYEIVRDSNWDSFDELRKTFSKADTVIVRSKRPVVVFDIGGGKYRLITSIHYNRALVFVHMFLTHAEYDKNVWKEAL